MPRYRHIVVLMDTDHDYGSILHDKYAPTINRLARQYGLASRYYTVADPDIANEMALLAGSPFGISDSAPYWDDQLHRTSPLTQLGAPHKTWKEYAQSLPYPGYLGDCFPVLCVETDSDVWAVGTNARPGRGVPHPGRALGRPPVARRAQPRPRRGRGHPDRRDVGSRRGTGHGPGAVRVGPGP